MAAEQTTLSLPPAPPAPAATTEAAPVATAPTGPNIAPGTPMPSLKDKIAGVIAAGEAVTKAEAAESAPAPAPSADPVDDVPAPPVVEPTKEAPAANPQPDPMAAFSARFEALEKQNATLLEQLAKLTAQPAPAPEPEKPKAPEAPKTLTDSPFEAQAKVYFGDLPKPLLTQATEVLERRHGWQMELRAAETAAAGGDAAARDRVQAAQGALAKVQTALERIEFDAQLAAQANQPPAPVAQSWGVVARDEVVDAALADRSNWKPEYQALEDHEVAAVLRAVPAGGSPEDYLARATKALDAYADKRKPASPTQAKTVPATPAQPKNPAPPAPAKPEVTMSGDAWANDQIPSKHEKMQRIINRARGDAMTN